MQELAPFARYRPFSLFHFPRISRLLSHFKDTVIFRHAGLSHLEPPKPFLLYKDCPTKGLGKAPKHHASLVVLTESSSLSLVKPPFWAL